MPLTGSEDGAPAALQPFYLRSCAVECDEQHVRVLPDPPASSPSGPSQRAASLLLLPRGTASADHGAPPAQSGPSTDPVRVGRAKDHAMTFWEVFWYIVIIFAFIAYLVILFSIFADLFSDHETSGGAKALWVVFLLIFPVLTSLVYLVVRGDGMAQRSRRSVEAAQQREASYIREVAGTSPAEQIQAARQLRDDGDISQQEFEALKEHALSGLRAGSGSATTSGSTATSGASTPGAADGAPEDTVSSPR